MSQRRIIADPFRFASESRSLEGVIPFVEMSRLADVLLGHVGEVSYTLSGEVDNDGQASLRLIVAGVLTLRCQRCLESMEWPLQLESLLRLARPGAPIPDEELEIDEFDMIEATPDMDVLALIEEEILLAVPVVPRHDSCNAPRPLGEDKKESPFAAIARLGKGGDAA